jgi:hypothetical protein
MGLTGGISDIHTLYDCLAAINTGLTDDSILDVYSDVRIKKWKEIIDPTSRANFRRLWAEDAIPERERYFEILKKMGENAGKEKTPEEKERDTAVSRVIMEFLIVRKVLMWLW